MKKKHMLLGHKQVVSNSFIVGVVSFSISNAALAADFLDDWEDQLHVKTFTDARTDDNANDDASLWNIDLGADKYARELYERPTSLMTGTLDGLPAAKTYFEFLDISTASVALDTDNEHAYFSIDLVGDSSITGGLSTVEGFNETYRVRVSSNNDFLSTDGEVNGYMFAVTDAGASLTGSFSDTTSFNQTQAWYDDPLDGNASGTGLDVTNEGTLGYTALTSLGATSDISSRLVDNSIQLAIDYGSLGLDKNVFKNILFEANSGDIDPLNAFLNDEYSEIEAGSPYDLANTPDSIYEIDTLKGKRGNGLKGAPVSAVGSGYSALFMASLMFLIWRRKKVMDLKRTFTA